MKKHLLTGLCLLAAATFTSRAGTTEITFPSQEDFDNNWVVVDPNDKGEWRWAPEDDFAGAPTLRWYRAVQGNSSDKQSPIIRTANPIQVNPGDVYIYFETSTADYNDDTKYWAYISEDPNFKTVTKTIVDGVGRYNTNGSKVAVYTKHPTSESAAKVTIQEGKQYYIGIQATGYGKYAGPNFFIVKDIQITQYDDTPDKCSSESITLHNETANGYATFSWKWPTKTKLGNPIGELGAKIYRCPDAAPSNNGIISDRYLIATLPIEARNTAETFSYDDKSVTTPGKYYYAVVPYNNLGDYEPGASNLTTKEAQWIGEDYQLLNPVALKGESTDTGVRLTYNFDDSRQTVGKNGGYVDPDKITFMFTRQKDSETPKTLTTTWKNFAEYVDDDLEGFAVYTYNIYALYNGDEENKSTAVNNTTNCIVVAGGYIDVDADGYSEDFTQSTSFNYFTVIGESTSYCWKHLTSSGYVQYAGSSLNSTSNLITPPLYLTAGKTYKLSFSAWKSGSNVNSFSIGLGDDVNSLTTIKNISVTGTSTAKQNVEVEFVPEKTGVNYLAFQAKVGTSSNINIDDIVIAPSIVSPGPATDLALEAAPTAESDNHASFSFKLPAVAKSGAQLNEPIAKAVVTRYAYGESSTNKEPAAEVIATLTEGLEPGKEISVDDNAPAAAYYAYSVVVELENGTVSDEAASPVVWVGYDTPKSVYNVSRTVDGDKTAATIKWSLYSGSQASHGGYIDSDNIKYLIYRSDKEEPIATLAVEEVLKEDGTFQFVDHSLLDKDLPWASYTYGVSVLNKDKESTRQTTASVIGGDALLEVNRINPSMTDDTADDLWDEQYWSIYASAKALRVINRGTETAFAYLPPVYLTDPAMLGSTLDLEMYREDDSDEDYKENGEVLEVYLYDLNLEEGQEPAECAMTRSTVIFPPVAEEILVGTFNVNAIKDEPMAASIEFVAPKPGKYRVGIKCASVKNVGLYISKFDLKLGATETVKTPEAVADFTAVPDADGANTATLSFVLPSLTTGGMNLTKLTKVEVLRAEGIDLDEEAEFENVALVEENLVPGETVVLTDNVPAAGFYTYRAVAYLGEEPSEVAEASTAWVGFDVPAAPAVTAVAENNGSKAVITWEMPETLGTHGGYVNASALTFKVYRNDSETALATVSETTYTDSSVASLPWAAYTYSVVPANGFTIGEKGSAAPVLAGDVVDSSEFAFDFEDSEAVALWEINGWAHLPGSLYAYKANGEEHGVSLPPFKADDADFLGCTISLDMNTESADNEEVLQVLVYKFDTAEDETPGTPGRGVRPMNVDDTPAENPATVAEFTVTSTRAAAYEAEFVLPSVGKYRVVLKCASAENQGLYINSLALNIGATETVKTPKAVTALTAVPDAEGANEVALEFTLPTHTTRDMTLSSLSKVVVLRAEGDAFEVVAVVEEDVEPGKVMTITDRVDEAGFYTYQVVAYVDEVASQAAEILTAWVGFDVPVAPEVDAVAENDGSKAVVSWKMPETAGVHGGYVDVDNLEFKVYRNESEIAKVTAASYTDEAVADLEWALYTYSVVPVNGAVEGEESFAEAVVAGDVITDNKIESDFTDEESIALWGLSGWTHIGSALYATDAVGEEHGVFLPPFRITDEKSLGCSIEITTYAEDTDNEEILHVYVLKLDDESADNATKVGEFTVVEDASHSATFNLPSTGKYRVALKCASALNKGLYVSSLSFENGKETDSIVSVALGNGLAVSANTVNLPDGCLAAEVYDLSGMKVAFSTDNATVDLTNLESGIYIVRAVLADGNIVSAKIAK